MDRVLNPVPLNVATGLLPTDVGLRLPDRGEGDLSSGVAVDRDDMPDGVGAELAICASDERTMGVVRTLRNWGAAAAGEDDEDDTEEGPRN